MVCGCWRKDVLHASAVIISSVRSLVAWSSRSRVSCSKQGHVQLHIHGEWKPTRPNAHVETYRVSDLKSSRKITHCYHRVLPESVIDSRARDDESTCCLALCQLAHELGI